MAKRGGFPGGMGNMNNLMKQAQRMQRQMEENQKALEEKEFTVAGATDMVKMVLEDSNLAIVLEARDSLADL